jgi:TRAP-type C4-dicarboxylate transport system substrate-binding protein
MNKIISIVLMTIIVSGLLLAGCGQAATTVADTGQTWDLKFSYHTPPQASLVGAYLKPWTAAIEQATNGRVKITHYAGETLVKAKDQFDGLVSGLSDIALVDTSETPGRFLQTEFDTLPYIFPDGAAARYYDILQSIRELELKEVQLVG